MNVKPLADRLKKQGVIVHLVVAIDDARRKACAAHDDDTRLCRRLQGVEQRGPHGDHQGPRDLRQLVGLEAPLVERDDDHRRGFGRIRGLRHHDGPRLDQRLEQRPVRTSEHGPTIFELQPETTGLVQHPVVAAAQEQIAGLTGRPLAGAEGASGKAGAAGKGVR